MKNQEHIAALLDRYMAAETTEQEECELAEYFRTADGIPQDWKPYRDMFLILDNGATRLTEGELEEHAVGQVPRLRLWPAGRAAAALALLLCIGTLAATIAYRAVTGPGTAGETAGQGLEATHPVPVSRVTGDDERLCLPASITFNNVTLDEVARKIMATYGCKVVLADSAAAALRLYFTLPKGSTIEDFVAIIDEYDILTATIQDSVVTVRKQEAGR